MTPQQRERMMTAVDDKQSRGNQGSKPHNTTNIILTPSFLRLAETDSRSNIEHDRERAEATYSESEDRNPRRALESLRQHSIRQRSEGFSKAGGTADPTRSNSSSYRSPTLDAEFFQKGVVSLERMKGEEHDVRFDPESNTVIKLTNPGEFGSNKGGLDGYLERLALTNELFDDNIRLEGTIQLTGESHPRVVTTQPWYRANEDSPHPDQQSIDQYMRSKGFLKAYDGAYLHESRDIFATDALPKNFITDNQGHIHPVDVILGHTSAEQEDRLQNMVNNQPQLPANTEPR